MRMHMPGEYKAGDMIWEEKEEGKVSNVLSYNEHKGTVYWHDHVHYQFPFNQ